MNASPVQEAVPPSDKQQTVTPSVRRTWHPYAIALYFVLYGATERGCNDSAGAIALCCAAALAVAWAIRASFTRRAGDTAVAAVLTSLALVPALLVGAIHDALLYGLTPPLSECGRYRYLIPAAVLVLGGAWFSASRFRRAPEIMNLFLNFFSISLIFSTVVSARFRGRSAGEDICALKNTVPVATLNTPGAGSSSTMPDIYYIILDGYARDDSLLKYWNYDNSPFTGYLEKKGFFVARQARSNYFYTLVSLASSLNMSPVCFTVGRDTPGREEAVLDRIRFSSVARFLRRSGYEIVNLSLFDILDTPAFYFMGEPVNISLARHLFGRTVIGVLWNQVKENILPSRHEARLASATREIIKRLPTLPAARSDAPRFAYAHIMMPHGPYLFDRHGNLRKSFWRRARDRFFGRDAYFEQLIYVNGIVPEILDAILSRSTIPPVIIVQSDHGSRLILGPGHQDEASANLNAFFMPGGRTNLLYSSISPVNNFRVVLNSYFGTDLPLLKDETVAASLSSLAEQAQAR